MDSQVLEPVGDAAEGAGAIVPNEEVEGTPLTSEQIIADLQPHMDALEQGADSQSAEPTLKAAPSESVPSTVLPEGYEQPCAEEEAGREPPPSPSRGSGVLAQGKNDCGNQQAWIG